MRLLNACSAVALAIALVLQVPAALAQSFNFTVGNVTVTVTGTPGGGCYEPNSTGLVLPVLRPIDLARGMCAPGWYCPNSFYNNASTWPAICPASSACIAQRLDYTPCAPQGVFEPQPCLGGTYCPTSYQRLECPSGYYCPPGSTSPRECSKLSLCPAGSDTEYYLGGLILTVVLVDALVLAVYFGAHWYLGRPTQLHPPHATESAAQSAARLIREALGGTQPVHVSFNNITVKLSEKHPQEPGKVLLQGVTGSLRAGEVTAIMGPTSAGKTLYLTALLGKLPPECELEGTMKVCGDSKLQDFAHLVGYVPQDDVLRADLTVAENVRYSSEVRLPADWSSEKRHELQSAVLRAMGIDHVRDVPIGDAEHRGVSGGQRKRCNVAVELAAAPAILFLDEATTGLDATMALEVVRLLKVIAREAQIPVAMVIHQPRVEIWNELDSVVLIALGGRLAYNGPAQGVAPYFTRVLDTSIFQGKGNPADLALDVVTHHGQALADYWANEMEPKTPAIPHSEPPTRVMAGFFKQLAMAHIRAVVELLRKAHVFLLDVFLGVIGGTLLTASALDSAYKGPYKGNYIVMSPRSDVQKIPMIMMLWGIAFAAALGPSGVRSLGSKRQSYWREAASGYSRVAYYIGASTAEVYRLLLSVLHFTAVVYLMYAPYTSFGMLFWILLLYGIAIDSQSVLLGNILDQSIAPLLATVVGVFTALFNGFPTIPGSFVFYAFALTELAASAEVSYVKDFFDTTTLHDQWSYNLFEEGSDYVNIFAWIIGLRVVGFIAMLLFNRHMQQ